MVPFDWDKVCLIKGPEDYLPEGSSWNISQELNEKYFGYVPHSSCDSGAQNDLFFIKNGKPVGVLPLYYCTYISASHPSKKPCFENSLILNFKDGDILNNKEKILINLGE